MKATNRLHHSELTGEIIGAAVEVHKHLGPALLESAYEECLCRELGLRGVLFERQKPLPLAYKGIALECGYRLDLLVVGLLMNFNVPILKDGIKRFVL